MFVKEVSFRTLLPVEFCPFFVQPYDPIGHLYGSMKD